MTEDLPEGTRFTDVLEAAQAAWMAGQYALARELIQRYIDPDGEFCCMRCSSTHDQPWKINGHLGTFYVCAECSTTVTQEGELLGNGGELFIEGPPQKITELMGGYQIGQALTVKTKTSQTRITVTKR